MKKLILSAFILLSIGSFARDYEYNEKRDVINPIIENTERISRFTDTELELEIAAAEINMEKYADFHEALDRAQKSDSFDR